MLLSLNALNLQTPQHSTAQHSTASDRCSRQTVGRLWFSSEVSKGTFRGQLAVADGSVPLGFADSTVLVRQCDRLGGLAVAFPVGP
jgi:hypothetical protein